MIDTEIDGKPVQTATHGARNGYLWMLDRDRGELKFLHAFPFSNNNVFTSIRGVPKAGTFLSSSFASLSGEIPE